MVTTLVVAIVHAQDRQPNRRPPRLPGRCGNFIRPDAEARFISPLDMSPPTSFVDGNNLLALVNRSPRWTLAPTFAPNDLVDVRTMRAASPSSCVPPDRQCLRREAAVALRALETAMARDGQRLWLDSGFRSYPIQCAVFQKWAYQERHGFCSAATFSALPGHSQHQLGTAIDVFTQDWVRNGERFRNGFGCSPGGRWLAAHAWEHGFVLPYPLHPDYRAPNSDCESRPDAVSLTDPRTGYKYEPWHIRYIGVANAARFHTAQQVGLGTASEITLEQWLRQEQHLTDSIEHPTCDGCNCGECETFDNAQGPCRSNVLALNATGEIVPASQPPRLVQVNAQRLANHLQFTATLAIPPNTLTQPPLVSPSTLLDSSQQFAAFSAPSPRTFSPLPHTWRLGISTTTSDYPWRIALVTAQRSTLANGTNARIAASTGQVQIVFSLPLMAAGSIVTVAVVSPEETRDQQQITVP